MALQAGVRGTIVRRHLKRQCLAATAIQTAWRRHSAVARWRLVCSSATLIQVQDDAEHTLLLWPFALPTSMPQSRSSLHPGAFYIITISIVEIALSRHCTFV